MKMSIYFAITTVLIIFFAASCKKSNNSTDSGNGLPSEVNGIASSADIANLQNSGMVIHEGTTPPVVNGIYLQHPDSCIFDNSGNNGAGKIFADYKFRFSNQNNTAYSVDVDLKDVTNYTDSASYNSNTYIVGSGNSFTIFAEVNGSLNGVNYVELDAYSGTLSTNGIENFQWSFYLKSKTSDPNNASVVPVGTTRVFDTGSPSLATISATY